MSWEAHQIPELENVRYVDNLPTFGNVDIKYAHTYNSNGKFYCQESVLQW